MPKDTQLTRKVGDKVTLEDGRKANVLSVSAAGGGVLLEVGSKGDADYETSWFGVDQLKTTRAKKATPATPATPANPSEKDEGNA